MISKGNQLDKAVLLCQLSAKKDPDKKLLRIQGLSHGLCFALGFDFLMHLCKKESPQQKLREEHEKNRTMWNSQITYLDPLEDC